MLLACFYCFLKIYSRIKKGEDQFERDISTPWPSPFFIRLKINYKNQGKYVTFSTMMHKEADESLEMTTHHV